MRFDDVAERVQGVPHMTRTQGRLIHDFVLAERPRDILELGFAHGVSACYMAAALEELGEGRIVTIDNVSARQRGPGIDELLERTGLGRYVEAVYAANTYTWELMKLIERNTRDGRCEPAFDFCYIDGAHAWEPDGLAFFLVDKLLRPGGWILFDDMDWSYESSSLRDTDFVRAMPADQQTTAQVRQVYSLLVLQHPAYGDFRVTDDNWGWARKTGGSEDRTGASLDSLLDRQSVRSDAVALARKVARRGKRLVREARPGRRRLKVPRSVARR